MPPLKDKKEESKVKYVLMYDVEEMGDPAETFYSLEEAEKRVIRILDDGVRIDGDWYKVIAKSIKLFRVEEEFYLGFKSKS